MTIVGLDQIARQLAVATQPQSVAPTLTRRQGVISVVNAGPPVSVDVTVGGIILPGVRYLASYAPVVNDVVWVDFNGADPLVIGSTSGSNPITYSFLANPPTVGTSSATFVDYPGPQDKSFTKALTATSLLVTWSIGAFKTTNTGIVDFGLRINSVDYELSAFFFNDLNSHRVSSGVRYLAGGLTAGTYTARVRWKTAAATVEVDGNDSVFVTIREAVAA